MIQARRKRLTRYEAELKYSSRRLKYLSKYHKEKYPVDVEPKEIVEHELDIDRVITKIISNKRLTRVKIKSLLHFISQHRGPKTEWLINTFLDCLIDQSNKQKNLVLNPQKLRDSYRQPSAWALLDKICIKRTNKK